MAEKDTVLLIKTMAKKMRRDVIEMGFVAGNRGAHFGPALSCIEIIASLYFEIMHHDPSNPLLAERDRFVQSKGHACLAYYSALVESNYIPREAMQTFKADGSFLAGHPCRNLKYGIEVSSGSLGNGFAIACGMAKAAKVKGEKHKVFCLLGDGECNEGLVWEAAMNAKQNKLDNLIAIVDRNGVQLGGKTEDIMDVDIVSVWRAFGWNVIELKEGNNIVAVLDALNTMKNSQDGKPHVIVANTIKGKGISFMENSVDWHARSMNKEQYEKAVSDLAKV